MKNFTDKLGNLALNLHPNELHVGLDVGSASVKLVVIGDKITALPLPKRNTLFRVSSTPRGVTLIVSKAIKVQGDPLAATKHLLTSLSKSFSTLVNFNLFVTGFHGKLMSRLLDIPYLNEFKAIAKGAAHVCPQVKSILEIGGDGSKFLQVETNQSGGVSIVDYQRNGDCAAGTGSFIDQQANRLKYRVEDIGELVKHAKIAASIAGRCSVFAKSDMIHAQQRGFQPPEILKGLCEAVVRNYKGTVLRAKSPEPVVLFVGGVAANEGVVSSLRQSFELADDQFIVPHLHAHISALGCALVASEKTTPHFKVKKLKTVSRDHGAQTERARKLDTSLVEFAQPPSIKNESELQENLTDIFLGVDIGSVSTNLVAIDSDGQVVVEIYTSTDGRPVEVVQRELQNLQRQLHKDVTVRGVGTTGSGRELIGELLGADLIVDEITAHKTGADFMARTLFGESVDTIFEIGGQDSKFIAIDHGTVVDFAMNEACAAGTGSFLEEQAEKMGISIKNDFADLALLSEQPLRLGERCTVFMEKDVTSFLQQGAKKEDIAAGLAYAVVHNYLNRVVRGRRIGEVIYFQGGTAYNKAVAAAFATVLNKRIVVPPHNGVMGAIGMALLAKYWQHDRDRLSSFRGFDLSRVKYRIRNIQCKACANTCDVQQVTVEGKKTYWGDKCSHQFRTAQSTQSRALIPDLFQFREDLLLQSLPGPDGLGIRIGVPRSLYYYDYFPFWSAYFNELGAELILSDVTNREIISAARETGVAEPCFPVVVSHGHIKNLVDKNVDYFFIPNLINAASNSTTDSWLCPWGQTLPYVLESSPIYEPLKDRFLVPKIRFRDGSASVERSFYQVARRLKISKNQNRRAVKFAYAAQQHFERMLLEAGTSVLEKLHSQRQPAVVLLGRPYNIYDRGMNLNIPDKLRQNFGQNIVPLDFLPLSDREIADVHPNMFWNYGRKILQAAKYVGQFPDLRAIYITNFKCGPDSYIKHFIEKAMNKPFLVLQFDGHGNDAGYLTRCEAFLRSCGYIADTGKSDVSQQSIAQEMDVEKLVL